MFQVMGRSARMLVAAVLGLAAAALATEADAVDPLQDWKTLTTPHFEIHYPHDLKAQAEALAGRAEAIHERLSKRLEWSPSRRTQLVLTDNSDLSNGFATPVPFNKIQAWLVPPEADSTLADYDDWLALLIAHEYTHTLHLDRASGAPKVVRHVLGRNTLTFPNVFQPTFLIEGLATDVETDADNGIGRGQSTMFDMAMRAELDGGIKPFDRVAMDGVTEWPAGRIPYLYGAWFYRYLREEHGDDAAPEYVRQYSNNLLPFLTPSHLAYVTGLQPELLWDDFQGWLREKQAPVLDRVRAEGEVAGRRLTQHGYQAESAVATDDGVLYVRNDGLTRRSLVRYRDGESEILARLNPGARIDWTTGAGVLVSQTEFCGNYRLYHDLYRWTEDDGLVRLTRCGRYRSAAWMLAGRRILAVELDRGRSNLVLLDGGGKRLRTLWQGDGDTVVGRIDVSPNAEEAVAPVWRAGRGWDLERFDFDAGTWQRLTRDSLIERGPRYSADGRSIVYSGEREGVYDIYRRYADGRTERLTRVKTGAFSPSLDPIDGGLVYLGYSGDGYDLHRLDEPTSLGEPAAAAAVPSPPRPEMRDVDGEHGEYNPLPTLRPTSWFPYVVGGEDVLEVGASTFGSDALGLHNYNALLTYETTDSLVGGSLGYTYADLVALTGSRSYDYELEEVPGGPTERVDRAELVFTLPWRSVNTDAGVHLGGAYEGRTPMTLDGEALAAFEFRDAAAGVAFTLDSTDATLLATRRHNGRDIRLVAETSDIADSDFTGDAWRADWREFFELPAGGALALRYHVGRADATARAFQLGGTDLGTEYVQRDELFNRRDFALRGYPERLAGLVGHRMEQAAAEYSMPLATVERAWVRPAFGLHRLHATVFAAGGRAWNSGQPEPEWKSSAGAELIGDVNVFYRFNLRLHLGYAKGVDEGGEGQWYLSAGTAF